MSQPNRSLRKESHRGDLAERMLLIPLLLAERPYTQRELARRFRISGKTIWRDMPLLERL